jgi:hypothetical protein
MGLIARPRLKNGFKNRSALYANDHLQSKQSSRHRVATLGTRRRVLNLWIAHPYGLCVDEVVVRYQSCLVLVFHVSKSPRER